MPEAVLLLVLAAVAQAGTAESVFRPGEEAIAYDYRPAPDAMRRIIGVPVETSAAALVTYVHAEHVGDRRWRDALERAGDSFWIENGTPCRVGVANGAARGPIIRTAWEVRLLNGHLKVATGWVETGLLRRRMRIRIEPPERYTEDNRDTPRSLALAYQAHDRVIYRELLAAREKVREEASGLPRRERQRPARSQVMRRERQAVLDRYDLDEATAERILDWGRRGKWPAR